MDHGAELLHAYTKEAAMKQHIGAESHARNKAARPLVCDHHFHVVHVAGRVIPGALVCESCGQRIVHRKKSPTADDN